MLASTSSTPSVRGVWKVFASAECDQARKLRLIKVATRNIKIYRAINSGIPTHGLLVIQTYSPLTIHYSRSSPTCYGHFIMKNISSFNLYLLTAVINFLGSGLSQEFITCPTSCAGCPGNGAFSVAGGMYYCTKQKKCPCNQAGSGCPTLCTDCPGGNYETKDMGDDVTLTFCKEFVKSSACSCISPAEAPPQQSGYDI